MTLSASVISETKPLGVIGAIVSMTVPDFDEAEDALDKVADDKLEALLRLFTDDALLTVEEVCGLVLVLLAVKPLPPSVEPPPPPPHALKIDMASTAKNVEVRGKGKLIINTTYCMGLRLDQIGLRESASI